MSGTVSNASIIGMVFGVIISIVVPIILLIVYAVKNKKMWIVPAWFLGAAGFFVTQVVIRLPILTAVSSANGFADFVQNHFVIYAIILGFTAGLFELIGRYVVAKIMAKKMCFQNAIAAGFGHGAIEAMYILGLAYISNISYAFLINSGAIDTVIAQVEAMGADTSQITALVEVLTTTSPVMYYLAGYERILTVICHIAMSLIVSYFVWKKQDIKGILICLAFHTALDSISGILSGLSTPYLGNVVSQGTGYAIIYTYLTVMTIIAVAVIIRIRKAWKVS